MRELLRNDAAELASTQVKTRSAPDSFTQVPVRTVCLSSLFWVNPLILHDTRSHGHLVPKTIAALGKPAGFCVISKRSHQKPVPWSSAQQTHAKELVVVLGKFFHEFA